ncbi:MAG: carboxypeptidase-like regulatory domain-containing protein [Bacteroidales bacterium]|nr:carboxypeptidase-like regulatory domain-containing protein [Bacteroidales bacterium]
MPFANIVIELGGSQEGGTTTDFEGNYTIKPIDPGQYNVRASYVGYQPVQQNNVIIRADQITFLDLEMTSQAQNLEEVVITDYKVPLISKDKTSSGGTMCFVRR